MEAWKWLDLSEESPALALSLTTARWGLHELPGNLVATTHQLDDILESANTGNKSAEVRIYTLPYTCEGYEIKANDGSLQHYNNGYRRKYPSFTTNSSDVARTELCNIPCAKSQCVILIEGIGNSRANILAISHVLSFFLSLGLTIVLIMSFFGLSKRPKVPKAMPPPGYTPPMQPTGKKYAEEVAAQKHSAKEIAACADLLREMYSLDLAIWGQEGTEDPSERHQDMFRANALFVEICRIVQVWRTQGGRWSSAERSQIEEIASFLDQHDRKRYNV